MRRTPRWGTAALAAMLVAAACSSDGDDTAATTADSVTVPSTSENTAASSELTVIATDIAFDADAYTVAAGPVDVTFVQEGQLPHVLALEDEAGNDLELDLLVNADETEASATIELEPGTYTLWCSIPGHRQAGQEAVLTVT